MQKKGQIRFTGTDNAIFFVTLRKRVEDYFRDNKISRNYNAAMVIKTIVLLTAYIAPFLLIIFLNPPFWIALIGWFIMGLAIAGIGMSVMHDANHGSYTSNEKTNNFIGYALNLLGGATCNWKFQHNQLHHTFTNIAGHDEDIDQKLGMRFNPHTKHYFFQRLQFFYSFIFYGIVTLYWVTLKDFIQFGHYIHHGVNRNSPGKNAIMLLKITLIKVIYFFCILFVPMYFMHIPVHEVVLGFLLMHFVGGMILSVVFQLAHTVEGTTHPLPDENGNIENNWAIHQMNTTADFSRKSKLISWYVGGLNFQVEHHLFPRICHVHYPAISGIVKQTAEECGVPYLENETLGDALRSHLSLLHKLGRVPSLSELVAG
ncbi:MAG TPA: acyl-CoA desaturase [Bacteroidia bacterium]|jgi:linoleoyl-CoA desaturase|nr:acyl-CoA desaturase [Bacteroidia bacterium]